MIYDFSNLIKLVFPTGSNVVEPFPRAWPERLVEVLYSDELTPLFNYAQGGAYADNNVGNPGTDSIKDTRSQIEKYTEDLARKQIVVGPGRVLYFHWVGVEPILEIWGILSGFRPSAGKDLPHKGDSPSDSGNKLVDQQVAVVRSQIEKMTKNKDIQTYPSTIVLMTIPPLEGSPRAVDQIKSWSVWNPDSAPFYHSILQGLVSRYNDGLNAIADSFKGDNSTSVEFVKVFDTTTTWNKILDSPAKYGIVNTNDSCKYCPSPNQYFYSDSLYPSKRVHAILGDDVARFINSIQV
ncbi:hypothetical protein DFH28DRAFT_1172660 [Melampsora americana]|nr:hypothetical protein DFH28DRAFT_1172660 [Melampsora americana]